MAKVVALRRARAPQDSSEAARLAADFAQWPAHLLSPELRGRVLRELRRASIPDEPLWPGGFFMLSRVQAVAIWEAIHSLPNIARRNQVHRAFDLICAYVERETNEVLLSREDLARMIGTLPRHISEIMRTLQDLGVISHTERRRVPGVRGPGEVVYFVNPHVAWNGELQRRKEAAKKVDPPLLKLMDGGKDDR